MAESSRLFNFDDYRAQIDEALAGNDEGMKDIPGYKPLSPGEIGGVAVISFRAEENPEPPEAA